MKGFHALFSSQNARESVKLPRILFTIFPDIVKSMELFHYHLKAEGITIASFFYLNFEKNVFKPYGDNAYSSKQSVRNWGFYVFWVGQNSYNNESALFNVPHCSTDWLYGVVNLQKGEQIFSTVALIPSKKLEIQHGKLQNVIWIDSAVHWWCCTSVVDNGHAQNCVCASCICIRTSALLHCQRHSGQRGSKKRWAKVVEQPSFRQYFVRLMLINERSDVCLSRWVMNETGSKGQFVFGLTTIVALFVCS